uniref:Retrotransposon gag domain-containing protein n=1 Tax=Araucaria cunninghamii TaxID=56994 RepID=A0A0D6RAW8_ARACU
MTKLEGKTMSMEDGLSEWRASVDEAVSELRRRLEESLLSQAKLQEEVTFWRAATTKLQEEVNSCRAAATQAMGYELKEPECYEGARDGRVLDDFLWDMGEYLASGGLSGEEEVRIAASYLKGTAKVWWRNLAGDIAEGRTTKRVESWDELKEALQEQFRPGNADWQARLKLHKLKHDGKIRDYINLFQDLMVEIKRMSAQDRLFMFEQGLQPWAQVELRRHKPRNVSDAIAVAGFFFDFKEKSDGKEDTQGHNTKGLSQPSGKPKSATQGGKRTQGSLKSISHLKGEKPASGANQANRSVLRCWTCNGPHTQNKCPQRQRVPASAVQQTELDDANEAEMGEKTQTSREAEVDGMDGLMYVEVVLKGKRTTALVRPGATHNFIDVQRAKELGLQYSAGGGQRVKSIVPPIICHAQVIVGVARDVKAQVGEWKGKLNVQIVKMNDFEMVLGIEFIRMAKVMVIPYLETLLIFDPRQVLIVKTFQRRQMGNVPTKALNAQEGARMFCDEHEKGSAEEGQGPHVSHGDGWTVGAVC